MHNQENDFTFRLSDCLSSGDSQGPMQEFLLFSIFSHSFGRTGEHT